MSAGAGLLLTAGGKRHFLPAFVVESVVPMPRLSAVPGSRVKLGLVKGRVLSVLELGPPSSHLVVCVVDGEPIGLSGVNVERSGFFEPRAGGVDVDGVLVSVFDVAEMVAAKRMEAT
jgi:hypothetical protein